MSKQKVQSGLINETLTFRNREDIYSIHEVRKHAICNIVISFPKLSKYPYKIVTCT